ncbi:MAG: transglutaminase domain-containing protein [Pirellulaceae bacterium]|jgi:transglutaminase-like putative cysteine protease|nr:transglutaminase domain-containing protein [Pirellulaceae bacterium]
MEPMHETDAWNKDQWMQALPTTSASNRLCAVAMLVAMCLGCLPNNDTTGRDQTPPASPAVPAPPADASAEPAQPRAIEVAAGQSPWITPDELPWDKWYLQYLDGNCIGYTHVIVNKSAIEGDTQNIRINRLDCIEVDNNGTKARYKRTLESLENSDGRMIKLTDTTQSFDGSTKTEGNRVQGRFKASTNKTTPTDTETISVNLDWDDSTWGVIGLQGVMMGHIPQPGELLHAQLFVPQLYKIAQAELLAGQPDLTALPGGQTQSLLAVDIILRSEDKGMLSRNWINERGEVLKTVALSGPNLSTFWTPAEIAHRTRDEFDLAELLATRVSLAGESPQSETRRVVYSVERESANGTEVFSLLAQSPMQSVVSRNALSAEATVTRPDRHSAAAADKPETAPDERCLQATKLIPASHPHLVSLANEWASGEDDSSDEAEDAAENSDGNHSLDTLALRLTRRAQQEIALTALDRNVTGVLQTVRQKRGDCVEQAMLLTSLLRAKQIPARTASGLIIDPQDPTQMQFHAWVEAWLGDHWLVLDSTTGGIAGPERLKFYDNVFTSDNPYEAILPTFREMQGLQVRVKEIE